MSRPIRGRVKADTLMSWYKTAQGIGKFVTKCDGCGVLGQRGEPPFPAVKHLVDVFWLHACSPACEVMILLRH